VELAIHEVRFDIDDLVADVDATLEGFLDAANDRRNLFLRNGTANDLAIDLDAFALLIRLNFDEHMTILTATTGLADEFAFAVSWFGDGFRDKQPAEGPRWLPPRIRASSGCE
jgi:hypothetical protein